MGRSAQLRILLSVGLLVVTAGCATSRGVVRLEQPPAPTVAKGGKLAFIKTVNDRRVFEEHPATQEIPSLGFEGSSAASADLKKRAVARKRNTFGKAMGDILLDEGQTVESVVKEALHRALSHQGYALVKDEGEVTADTLVINASIDKFWAYMTPGFWAITLACDISTNLDMELAKTSFKGAETIAVKSEGGYQTGAEGNYMEIIRQALDRYVEEVGKKLSVEL